MKFAWAIPILTSLFLGCATTDVDGPSPATAEAAASKSDEGDLEEIERKLKVATERLMVAELELSAFELQQENELRYAKAEVAMAAAKLEKFRAVDAPSRIASGELDLQTTKDRAQEAKDELAQIEIMYEDQDLDDLTAEFVVSRGRRAAKRAQARIEIQEAQFSSLKERELPQEEQAAELALDKAQAALKKAGVEGKINLQKKSIAIQEARNAVDKLLREQKELGKEAQP